MKHRISLLSTTGIGVTLLWFAAISLPGSAYAFDIGEGESIVSNQAAARVMRGRISLRPTPTQSSRKGLVFPRVYEEDEESVAAPIAFTPLGSTTTVQPASNTMAVPVQSAPVREHVVLTPPAAPVAQAYIQPAPTAYEQPAPATRYVAPAPVAKMSEYAAPVPNTAYAVPADSYAAIAPAASARVQSSTPAPVQTSTRVFNPLELPPAPGCACQAVAPVAYPSTAPQVALAPTAPPSVGAPEPLAAEPLAPTGPKARSAQITKNPTQPIVPPAVLSERLADLPKEQLSRKTKAVVGTIPSKLDTAKVEKTEKFDLSRTAASVDALDLKKAGKVDAYESAGIKISVRRPGLDTNYELNRAYNALTSGDTSAAMQTYKDILSVEPTNQDALFGLASLYHRQGDVAHARPLYAVLLKNYPTHREGINNFLVLVSDESPQEALAELERLEQRNPDFSPIPAQQALVLERLGYSSEAQAKMSRAIDLAPENLTYKYNLAVMMDRQRNYPQAIALYRLLLDSSSKGAQLPASADSIQRRVNHLATVVNSGNIPTVNSSRTL